MTDINEIKRELEALTAKVAAYEAAKARNWPERIEAGMVFRARSGYEKEGDLFVAAEDEEPYLLHAATGRFYNRGKYFWDEFPWERYEYLGMAANGLVWSDPTQACENAADAHEPTGAELVGILEDIRNVSNNPGRTLTTLGLTECLQSCNVMARNALDGLAK